MSVGYSREFNDQARPGYSPEAADAAMRRQQDSEQIQDQQAFQRQVSGAAENSGEMTQGAGARRQMTEDADRQERERKDQVDRQILLANLEDRLEAQYGEHFAENLFADLLEEGLIEQDEYTRIMAIADEDERRIAIAAAIQRGIDEGRINPDDLEGHPWAQGWLNEHRAAAAVRNAQEAELRNGQRAIHDARVDAQEVASEGISSAEQEVFDTSMARQENENQVSQSAVPGGGFSPV
ncbi:hypothetical protein [Maricaulis alexandrii]|uniref:hypothetical protein n=1 Tax=Maricaulis alexandrii TaxID=2570354 RepID=UPI001108667A|nr:hypothetical protein [Maricaulis alexandrii]